MADTPPGKGFNQEWREKHEEKKMVREQGLRQDSEAATINELAEQSKRICC